MASKPWLLRQRPTNPGSEAEKHLAKRLGGRTTPASGALDRRKGDVELGRFLLESKSTAHASLAMKLSWLRKIEREAIESGRLPALSIQFTDRDGSPQPGGAWVAVPEQLFAELVAELTPRREP